MGIKGGGEEDVHVLVEMTEPGLVGLQQGHHQGLGILQEAAAGPQLLQANLHGVEGGEEGAHVRTG